MENAGPPPMTLHFVWVEVKVALFSLPVTYSPSYREQAAEGSPVQYHYPGRRNRFRTVKQPAQGHTVGRWNWSMCLQEEDSEEKHAFPLQDPIGNQEEKQPVQCSSFWFGSSPRLLASQHPWKCHRSYQSDSPWLSKTEKKKYGNP